MYQRLLRLMTILLVTISLIARLVKYRVRLWNIPDMACTDNFYYIRKNQETKYKLNINEKTISFYITFFPSRANYFCMI